MVDRRQQPVADLLSGGDVHRGRKGVVAALAPVDVVVRVHRLLAAQLTAGHLDGAVGDHLVAVHVRLRSRTGLPDAQREVRIEFSRDHLVTGAADQFTQFRIEFIQLDIRLGCRLLEHTEGADDRTRHQVVADVEVEQRAGCLCPPITVGGNLELTHRVPLQAHVARTCSGDSLGDVLGYLGRTSRFRLQALLDQSHDGRRASVLASLPDLPVEPAGQLLGQAHADDAAVARPMSRHGVGLTCLFIKYDLLTAHRTALLT